MIMDTLRALVPLVLLVDLTTKVWVQGVGASRTWGGRDSIGGSVNSADFYRLTVWIEGREIEHFVGFPLDIYIVQDGEVAPYLREAYMDNHLPILPPEVTQVEISWMARDQRYRYVFPDLRSLDPHVMYDPLMSIPEKGFIPHKKSSFQITLSCTGENTGIASMYLSLGIFTSDNKHIPGSPLKLHIRKRCIAFAESKTACEGCKNGGRCDSGKCHCRAGYFGIYCQYASCFPQCMNNGTCTRPGKCLCPKGFSGDRCEKAKCKDNCNGRGTCASPNACNCNAAYYGNRCEHKKGLCQVPCQNGGVCTTKNTCECRKGYLGQFCQKPTCSKSCGVHGVCADLNTCECRRGWRGRFCHKTVKPNKRIRHTPRNGKVTRSERHINKNKNKRRKSKKKRKKRTKKKETLV